MTIPCPLPHKSRPLAVRWKLHDSILLTHLTGPGMTQLSKSSPFSQKFIIRIQWSHLTSACEWNWSETNLETVKWPFSVPGEVELDKEKSKADRNSGRKGFLPPRQLTMSWFQLCPPQEDRAIRNVSKAQGIFETWSATKQQFQKRQIPVSAGEWHIIGTQ